MYVLAIRESHNCGAALHTSADSNLTLIDLELDEPYLDVILIMKNVTMEREADR
jgi:hypothetical protein